TMVQELEKGESLPQRTGPCCGFQFVNRSAIRQDESRPPFLKLSAPAESGLLAANPRVINLYLAAQGFPSRIHHRSAEFVKHHPRGLVTRQTKLALQKQGRYATLVRGHQIRRPEPMGQRNLRAVKNGPRCQRNLVPTLGALVALLVHQFVAS